MLYFWFWAYFAKWLPVWPASNDILPTVPGFSSGFKALSAPAPELTKPMP
jgi:hypothetical protein